MSDRLILVEAVILYLPIALAIFLWWRYRPLVAVGGALLLSFLWNAVLVFLVNQIAFYLDWWTYAPEVLSYRGLPFSVWLSWSIAWGIVAPLLPIRNGVLVMLAAFGVDWFFMPYLDPLLHLHDNWLLGEWMALLLALLPGMLLFRWTLRRRLLWGKVVMQGFLFFSFVAFFVPDLIFIYVERGTWELPEVSWWQGALQANVFFFFVVLGLSAVAEFVRMGRGTPVPFDPPQRMVTSGVYAYLANPMQLSTCGALLTYAWIWQSSGLLIAAAMVFVYSWGIALFSESDDLSRRWGERWMSYRSQVHYFWPRWRPYSSGREAVMYFDSHCTLCHRLGRWLQAKNPLDLRFVAAREYPGKRSQRLRYVDQGQHYEGVVALARGLSHVHLGWLLVAVFMQFPGVCHVLQCIVDAEMLPEAVPSEAISTKDCMASR